MSEHLQLGSVSVVSGLCGVFSFHQRRDVLAIFFPKVVEYIRSTGVRDERISIAYGDGRKDDSVVFEISNSRGDLVVEKCRYSSHHHICADAQAGQKEYEPHDFNHRVFSAEYIRVAMRGRRLRPVDKFRFEMLFNLNSYLK